MKIEYLAEDIPMALTKGKIYEVIALEKGPDLVKGKGEIDWLRIVCDSGIFKGFERRRSRFP